jgi:hypothetical protein
VREDSLAALLADISEVLRAAASSTSGWPYFGGQSSRLEPTCWALLALMSEGGTAFLERCQPHGALMADDPHQPPNLAFNGLAAVLTLSRPDVLPGARTSGLLAAIAGLRGIAVPQAPEFRQDNSLTGWPWIDGTFSWVEPTSWCLLALKKMKTAGEPMTSAIESRIVEGERLLIDRACASGGWNFGNSAVLGQDLRPYVATTAIALLALQDRRSEPVVARSLAYLEDHALTQASGMSLALSLICFHVFKLDPDALQRRLAAQWRDRQFLGNVHVTAMALYALNHVQHGTSAFAL